MGRSTMKAVLGPWSDVRTFDKLRRLLPVLLHHRSLSTNRNLAFGLWQLMLRRRCDLRKFLHRLQREVLDLQSC
jgi:hypothetical protein